jgi:hypothetical protein
VEYFPASKGDDCPLLVALRAYIVETKGVSATTFGQSATIELSHRTPDRDDSLALLRLVSRHLHHSSAALDPTTAPIEIILACLDDFADKSFSLPF